MKIQDKIKQSINIEDSFSVKRGFNKLWALFGCSNNKSDILNTIKLLRNQLTPSNFEWKRIIKHIDSFIVHMQKELTKVS